MIPKYFTQLLFTQEQYPQLVFKGPFTDLQIEGEKMLFYPLFIKIIESK